MSGFGGAGIQTFNTGARGKEPDVQLILDGQRVLIAERYKVRLSYLTQPAAFSLTFGTAETLGQMKKKYPPGTRFSLLIAGRQVMTGRIDGWGASGAASALQVEGRDALAPLHDTSIELEQSFTGDTIYAFVRKVLDGIGLSDRKLLTSNQKNRAHIVGNDPQGYKVKDTNPKAPRNAANDAFNAGAGGATNKHVQAQLGEKGYDFLKRHLDRAGLFLFCDAFGDFILAEPYTAQVSAFRIQRNGAGQFRFSDVVDFDHQNKTAGRYSRVSVYTRGETKRGGRPPAVTTVHDTEMEAWGFDRVLAFRDANCDTVAKAEFMARRKMAEQRRAGWKLSYTLAGVTAGSPLGGRLVLAPDTMIEVDDQQLDIDEDLWCEAVTFACDGKATTTTVELMRPQDLIFGDEPT